MHPQKGGLSLSGRWWERGWRCQDSRMITKYITISWHTVWVRRAICINVRHELNCREWLAEDGSSSDRDSWVLVNRENGDDDQRGRASGNGTKGTNYDVKHHCSRIPHLRTFTHWKQHLCSRKFLGQETVPGGGVAGTQTEGYEGYISWTSPPEDASQMERERQTPAVREILMRKKIFVERERLMKMKEIVWVYSYAEDLRIANEQSWVCVYEEESVLQDLNGSRSLNQVDGRFRRMFINVPRVSDVLPRSWTVWEVSDLRNSTSAHTWPSFTASYMI